MKDDKNRQTGYKKVIDLHRNKIYKMIETNKDIYKQNDISIENKQTSHSNVKQTSKQIQIAENEHVHFKLKICSDGFVSLKPSIDVIANVLSKKEGAFYNFREKEWKFKVSDYFYVERLLSLHKIPFNKIPAGVIDLLCRENKINEEIPAGGIYDKLMPFQVESVKFALSKGGRILLADDMGLGKTIQAIAIFNFYLSEWPVLIVAPASVLNDWKESINRFLGRKSTIIHNKTDLGDLISIISYQMATKFINEIKLMEFKIVVCDECHNLKSDNSQRTKNLMPVLQKASRLILISGTPAVSRPIELFPLFQALNKDLFKNMWEYGRRYCNAKKIGNWIDYKGCSNSEELTYLLEREFMIRRGKEVLENQLPSKTRKHILLEASKKSEFDQKINKEIVSSFSDKNASEDVMAAYRKAAELKLDVVVEYVMKMVKRDKKLLVFAHHSVMIDGIESKIKENGLNYIKIDGKVPSKKRHQLINKFQDEDEIKIGILSLTAAGAGITLTAAKLVIFAELYWNPGVLKQAEDRIYRIGQTDNVEIHYLVCKNTVDEIVWPYVIKKLGVLESIGVGKNDLKKIKEGPGLEKTINDFCRNK